MFKRLLAVAFVFTTFSLARAEDSPLVIPSPPAATQAASKDLAALIEESIKLLEANKNKEAIELLMQPSLVAAAKADGTFDGIVNGFAGGKAQALLSAFKAIRGQAPKFSDDQTKATFTLPQNIPDMPSRGISFINEGGVWHIEGH